MSGLCAPGTSTRGVVMVRVYRVGTRMDRILMRQISPWYDGSVCIAVRTPLQSGEHWSEEQSGGQLGRQRGAGGGGRGCEAMERMRVL